MDAKEIQEAKNLCRRFFDWIGTYRLKGNATALPANCPKWKDLSKRKEQCPYYPYFQIYEEDCSYYKDCPHIKEIDGIINALIAISIRLNMKASATLRRFSDRAFSEECRDTDVNEAKNVVWRIQEAIELAEHTGNGNGRAEGKSAEAQADTDHASGSVKWTDTEKLILDALDGDALSCLGIANQLKMAESTVRDALLPRKPLRSRGPVRLERRGRASFYYRKDCPPK